MSKHKNRALGTKSFCKTLGSLGLFTFMIITFATVLLNKRFLFDRLSGANYQSTIKKSEKNES